MRFGIALFSISMMALLSACGPKGDAKVESLMAEQKYEAALKAADKLIEKDTGNLELHSLAVQAQWLLCVQNGCLNERDIQTKLARHMMQLNKSRRLQNIALTRMLPPNSDPATLDSMLRLSLRIPSADLLDTMQQHAMKVPISTFGSFDKEASLTMLGNLKSLESMSDKMTQDYLTFLELLLRNDINELRTHLTQIASVQDGPTTPAVLQLLVPTLYLHNIESDPQRGAEIFATDLVNQIDQLGIQWLRPDEAKAEIAKGLKGLIKSRGFSDHAKQFYTFKIPDEPIYVPPAEKVVEEPAPSEGEEGAVEQTEELPPAPSEIAKSEPSIVFTSDGIFNLWLTRQQLLLNPQKEGNWSKFFDQALGYILAGGDLAILQGFAVDKIPNSALKPFNERILDLIERQLAAGGTDSEFFDLLLLPSRGATTYINAKNKLLRQAIKANVEIKNAQAILGLAILGPEVARQERQNIFKFMLSEIDELWKEDRFDDIIAIASFLRRDLEIEFNLDNLLLKKLNSYFEELNLAANLTSDTPDLLLQTAEEVVVDLGPKFAFAQEYFASNPLIIDSQLKKIIRDTPGLYGSATALYALQTYFDEGHFPAAEREIFLINSIKNALTSDQKLLPIDLAQIGFALHQAHPDLEIDWLIDLVAERTTTVDEAKAVWEHAPEQFKQTLINSRPQFAAIMYAQEFLSDQDYGSAAQALTAIRSEKYLTMASVFVNEIRAAAAQFIGTWAVPQTNVDQPLWLIELSQPALSSENNLTLEDLMGLKVEVTAAIGNQPPVENPETLKQNFGQVSKFEERFIWSPAEQRLKPGNPLELVGTDNSYVLSELVAQSKTDVSPAPSLKTVIDGLPNLTLDLISNEIGQIPLPSGRFGIMQQVKQLDNSTDFLLPTGSILELRVNQTQPLVPQSLGKSLGIVLPVAGSLRHPTSSEPVEVRGFYDIDRKLSHLAYTYNLPSGASIDARQICQIIAQNLRCAGHHKHWDKMQYAHVVVGRRARGGKAQEFFDFAAFVKPDEAPETLMDVDKQEATDLLELLPTTGDDMLLEFPDLFSE